MSHPTLTATRGLPERSAEDLELFSAFGYAKLPGAITDRQGPLFDEVRDELAQAYPDTDVPPSGDDGRQGYFLPAMKATTPTSLELVAALEPWARQLLGAERVVPVYADVSVFFGPTPWHTDIGMPVRFVKFSTYADALNGDNGALRFVPGSHLDPLHGALKPIIHRLESVEDLPTEETVRRVPHVVVDTDPGDVVAIDGRVWHATTGGGRRLQWSVPFIDADDEEMVVRFFRSFFVDAETRGHDGRRFPFYGEEFLASPLGREVTRLGGAAVARERQEPSA